MIAPARKMQYRRDSFSARVTSLRNDAILLSSRWMQRRALRANSRTSLESFDDCFDCEFLEK